jgi:uncharacterized protein with beta-barrel porin domain
LSLIAWLKGENHYSGEDRLAVDSGAVEEARGAGKLSSVMHEMIGRARLVSGRIAGSRAILASSTALFLPLLVASPAFADCQPNSAAAVSGQTVNCTGTAPTGFQAGAGVNNLFVNVQPGATVQDNGAVAIKLNSGNTATNNGTVTAGAGHVGILALDGNTITNNTSITVGNNFAIGISVNNSNTISNLGTITAGDTSTGIQVTGTGNSVTNSGTVTVGVGALGVVAIGDSNIITNSGTGAVVVGTGGFAINLLGNSETVTNNGAITGPDNASGIFGTSSSNNNIVNKGTIVLGNGSTGIDLLNNNVVFNSGAVTAGVSGLGIAVGSNNTVTVANTGTVTVGDNGFAVEAVSSNTVLNAGTINAGAGAIGVLLFGSNNNVVNNGTIAVGDGSEGIGAGGSGSGNVITNNGLITLASSHGAFAGVGIFTGSGTVAVTNNGQIVGGDNTDGIATAGTADTVINNGTVTVGAATIPGKTSVGIAGYGSSSTITNNGNISAGAGGIGIGAGSGNTIINNGTVIAGPNGVSIGTCFCAPQSINNTVVNNGTVDGAIKLIGFGNTFTNGGLITITDPGTAVGAFHEIFGTFTQTATGTLTLRVNAAGAGDSLGAFSANLAGTLRAVVQPGLYGLTTIYNAVITSSGLSGTFNNVVSTSPSPFLNATVSYTATNANLILTRTPLGSVPGETQNERAVGNFLESNYSTSLTGPAATFFTTLLASPSIAPLDQLSGEGTSGTQESAFMAVDLFMASLTGQGTAWLSGSPAGATGTGAPMQYAAAKPEHPAFKALKLAREQASPWSVWASGFGGTQSLGGDPTAIGSASLSHRTAGGAVGVNYQANPDLLVGWAAGGSSSDFSVPDRATSGHLDGAHVGAFGVQRWGGLYALGTASYGWFDNSTTRTITGIGPSETATGRFASNQLGGRLEVGFRHPFDRMTTVTPFAAVQFLELWQNGYTETSITSAGAPGVLGLSFQAHAVSSLPTFLGAQVETRYVFGNGAIWAPFGRASWVHEFEPTRDVTASLTLLPVGTFTAEGPRAASDAARIEAGSNLFVTKGVSWFGTFIGEFSNRGPSYSGNGGLRVTW